MSLWKNLGRDSTAEKNPSRGHRFQRQVSSFRSIDRYPEIERSYGQWIGPRQRGMGNGSGCASPGNLRGEAGRLHAAIFAPQKFINIHQPGPGENTLITYMAIADRQETQEVDLQIALRGEIRVPAFAGKNLMLRSIPEESGFTQTSSRSDHRLITDGQVT